MDLFLSCNYLRIRWLLGLMRQLLGTLDSNGPFFFFFLIEKQKRDGFDNVVSQPASTSCATWGFRGLRAPCGVFHRSELPGFVVQSWSNGCHGRATMPTANSAAKLGRETNVLGTFFRCIDAIDFPPTTSSPAESA